MISICVTTARGHKNQYTINILLLILLMLLVNILKYVIIKNKKQVNL